MIELNDEVRALWFVTLPKHSDWLAVVREKPDGERVLTYRFRYSNSDEPWDAKDRKNWYEMTTKAPLTQVIERVSEIASALARKASGERYELIRGSATLEQFAEQFMALPFIHAKVQLNGDTQ